MNDDKKATMGGQLSFHVIRNGKKVHEHKNVHNMIGQNFFAISGRIQIGSGAPFGSTSFITSTSRCKTVLSSTWQQVGNTVSRTAGVDTWPSSYHYLSWPGGISGGYILSGSGTSGAVSKSVNVSPTTGMCIYDLGNINTGIQQSNITAPVFGAHSYSSGVISRSTTGPVAFPVVTTPYTMRSIRLREANNSYAISLFDLPSDINLLVGDQVVVSAVTYTVTYAQITPVAFAVSPIAGITSAGTFQKLLPADIEYSGTVPTRIYLVNNTNAVTVPNVPAYGASQILSSSITPSLTITGSGSASKTANTTATRGTFEYTIFGTVASTQSNIKQIYVGTVTNLFAVIDFTTPQTIAAGKVLTINVGSHMDIELPLY
jgi:hypothetical protein